MGWWIALGVGGGLLPAAFLLDPALMRWVGGFDWSGLMPAIQGITRLGYGALDVALLLVLAGIGRWRGKAADVRRGLAGGAAVAAAGLLGQLLKNVACRARPAAPSAGAFLVEFPCLFAGHALASFPSGHATTAFAAAVFLSRWYPRWSVLFLGLAGLVGATRVILGSHYPSDVLAGAVLGTAAALVGWRWVAAREMQNGKCKTDNVKLTTAGN